MPKLDKKPIEIEMQDLSPKKPAPKFSSDDNPLMKEIISEQGKKPKAKKAEEKKPEKKTEPKKPEKKSEVKNSQDTGSQGSDEKKTEEKGKDKPVTAEENPEAAKEETKTEETKEKEDSKEEAAETPQQQPPQEEDKDKKPEFKKLPHAFNTPNIFVRIANFIWHDLLGQDEFDSCRKYREQKEAADLQDREHRMRYEQELEEWKKRQAERQKAMKAAAAQQQKTAAAKENVKQTEEKKKTEEKKVEEKKTEEKKTEEKKVEEKKTEEKKVEEKKTEEKKPEEKKVEQPAEKKEQPKSELDLIKERLEKLEKENAELRKNNDNLKKENETLNKGKKEGVEQQAVEPDDVTKKMEAKDDWEVMMEGAAGALNEEVKQEEEAAKQKELNDLRQKNKEMAKAQGREYHKDGTWTEIPKEEKKEDKDKKKEDNVKQDDKSNPENEKNPEKQQEAKNQTKTPLEKLQGQKKLFGEISSEQKESFLKDAYSGQMNNQALDVIKQLKRSYGEKAITPQMEKNVMGMYQMQGESMAKLDTKLDECKSPKDRFSLGMNITAKLATFGQFDEAMKSGDDTFLDRLNDPNCIEKMNKENAVSKNSIFMGSKAHTKECFEKVFKSDAGFSKYAEHVTADVKDHKQKVKETQEKVLEKNKAKKKTISDPLSDPNWKPNQQKQQKQPQKQQPKNNLALS